MLLRRLSLLVHVQVKVRLNLHGVVGVESVQQVDEEEYEEKVKRPAPKVRMLFFMSLWLQRAISHSSRL